MYYLIATKHFEKNSSKLCKRNPRFKEKIINVLNTLGTNPFSKSLKSHKVNYRIYGRNYSSRVTGDIRIIWNFSSNNKITIYLLDIGGHSGNRSVYK